MGNSSSNEYMSDSETMNLVNACLEFSRVLPSVDLVCACICEAYVKHQNGSEPLSAFDRMCLSLRYSEFVSFGVDGFAEVGDSINASYCYEVSRILLGILGYSFSDVADRLKDYGLQ